MWNSGLSSTLPWTQLSGSCFWVIQSAMGPVSQGVCQACGEVRDFKNYVESASWGDTKLGNRSRGQSKDDVAGTAASRGGDKEETS